MSVNFEPTTSTTETAKPEEQIMDLTVQQNKLLTDIKKWVETDADFYGRTDDKFLLVFLHGCKFDLEKTKTKMNKYYEYRKKFPNWWICQDSKIGKIMATAEFMTTTATVDSDDNQPTLVITQLSRGTPSYTDFDDYVQLHSFIFETLSRRKNCQLNGVNWLVDCQNYSLRIVPRLLSPFFLRDIINYFMSVTVLKIKSVNFLNTPAIASGAWSATRPFLRSKIRDRFHFYDNDWSALFTRVHKDQIPEEFGGNSGPIQHHHDKLLQELQSQTDYILESSKYGFLD